MIVRKSAHSSNSIHKHPDFKPLRARHAVQLQKRRTGYLLVHLPVQHVIYSKLYHWYRGFAEQMGTTEDWSTLYYTTSIMTLLVMIHSSTYMLLHISNFRFTCSIAISAWRETKWYYYALLQCLVVACRVYWSTTQYYITFPHRSSKSG